MDLNFVCEHKNQKNTNLQLKLTSGKNANTSIVHPKDEIKDVGTLLFVNEHPCSKKKNFCKVFGVRSNTRARQLQNVVFGAPSQYL